MPQPCALGAVVSTVGPWKVAPFQLKTAALPLAPDTASGVTPPTATGETASLSGSTPIRVDVIAVPSMRSACSVPSVPPSQSMLNTVWLSADQPTP